MACNQCGMSWRNRIHDLKAKIPTYGAHAFVPAPYKEAPITLEERVAKLEEQVEDLQRLQYGDENQ